MSCFEISPGRSGYLGIGPEEGIFVPENIAFEYALERCMEGTAEDKKRVPGNAGGVVLLRELG